MLTAEQVHSRIAEAENLDPAVASSSSAAAFSSQPPAVPLWKQADPDLYTDDSLFKRDELRKVPAIRQECARVWLRCRARLPACSGER